MSNSPDIKQLEKRVTDSLKSLPGMIEDLQQCMDITNDSLGKSRKLEVTLSEKMQLISSLEEEIVVCRDRINKLEEETKSLRQKSSNQKADINALRTEREKLNCLLDKTLGELEKVKIAMAKIMEINDISCANLEGEDEVADPDRDKHLGMFVCSNNIPKDKIAKHFENLVKELPQFNWGKEPVYIRKGQSLTMSQGVILVVIFTWGMEHPCCDSIKLTAKSNGADVISGNRSNIIITQINNWFKNSSFDATNVSCPI